MAPRSIGPYIESPGSYGRRTNALSFWVWIAILLVVVAFVIFRIVLPQGPVEALSDRQARKRLAEAQRLEGQSLNYFAAELYSNIVESNRVGNTLRVQAARGLARIYRTMPNRLDAVEAALEKAYYFSPPGADKNALRDELENLSGHPLTFSPALTAQTSASLAAPAAASTPAAVGSDAPALPKDARILARIGSETVSMEEILYAWGQFNKMRDPSPEELKSFAGVYLDMVLLADEARHLGLSRQPRAIYHQRVQRILGLSQMVTEKMIKDLKTPDAKTMEAYYKSHKALFTTPARATIGQILASNENAARVAKALAQGQRFEKVARQYGLDGSHLKNGYILGTVSANDPGIPGLLADPTLAARLVAMEDNTTTGPLTTPRGQLWLRVVEKTPPVLRPFKEAQEEALYGYQNQKLAEQRAALLKQLHDRSPIEILDPAIRQAIQARPGGQQAPTTHTAVARQAAEATTSTRVTTAAPPRATDDTRATTASRASKTAKADRERE